MEKAHIGSVVLLGLLMAGVSGLAVSGSRHGRVCGYGGHQQCGRQDRGRPVPVRVLPPGPITTFLLSALLLPPYYYPPSSRHRPTEPPVYVNVAKTAEPGRPASAFLVLLRRPASYYPMWTGPGWWQGRPGPGRLPRLKKEDRMRFP